MKQLGIPNYCGREEIPIQDHSMKRLIIIIIPILLTGIAAYIFKDSLTEYFAGQPKTLTEANRQSLELKSQAEEQKSMGKIYLAAGKYLKAAEKLKSALRRNKKSPDYSTYKNMMINYYHQGINLYIQEALKRPADKKLRVSAIYDGDTIELENGEKIRYLGINSPEIAHKPGERDQPYGREATRANSRQVGNRTVQLKFDGETRGRYGRTLAYVFCGNRFVNAELLKQGMAKYYSPGGDIRYSRLFQACQYLAKEKKLGIWKKKPARRRFARTTK